MPCRRNVKNLVCPPQIRRVVDLDERERVGFRVADLPVEALDRLRVKLAPSWWSSTGGGPRASLKNVPLPLVTPSDSSAAGRDKEGAYCSLLCR